MTENTIRLDPNAPDDPGDSQQERRDPTWEEIDSPEFNAIWDVVKHWDIERYPGAGRSHATGTDVVAILDALADAS